MWIILLCWLCKLTEAVFFPETYRYEVTGNVITIGECITFYGITNFPQNGSETITWEKDTKPLKGNPRIKANGKSLSVTSATRDDGAYYKITVNNKYKNVIEITDIWLNVKGCGKNEKENSPISSSSCTSLCTGKCSEGWTYIPETASKCVQYFPLTKTWSKASEHCQSVGAELVTINTPYENKFISDMLQTAVGGWIGLNDRSDEGIYIWNFKKTNKPSFYTWGINEPSNFNRGCNIENCVMLRKNDGKWNDVVCQSFSTYICEVQPYYNGTDRSEWSCTERRCYKYFHSDLVWTDALERCHRIHSTGRLATIESDYENGVIQGLLITEEAWIGLNDIWEAGRYTWNSYRGRSEKCSYTNWGKGEPNDKFLEPFAPDCFGEDCVQIKQFSGNVTWTDLGCESKLPYICEVIRTRQFSTGAYVGMIIGSLLLVCIIAGVIQLAYEKHKRTAVKDIIKAAYDENILLQKTNPNHISFKEAVYKVLPTKKNKTHP